jgi:hypothetical protein
LIDLLLLLFRYVLLFYSIFVNELRFIFESLNPCVIDSCIVFFIFGDLLIDYLRLDCLKGELTKSYLYFRFLESYNTTLLFLLTNLL